MGPRTTVFTHRATSHSKTQPMAIGPGLVSARLSQSFLSSRDSLYLEVYLFVFKKKKKKKHFQNIKWDYSPWIPDFINIALRPSQGLAEGGCSQWALHLHSSEHGHFSSSREKQVESVAGHLSSQICHDSLNKTEAISVICKLCSAGNWVSRGGACETWRRGQWWRY